MQARYRLPGDHVVEFHNCDHVRAFQANDAIERAEFGSLIRGYDEGLRFFPGATERPASRSAFTNAAGPSEAAQAARTRSCSAGTAEQDQAKHVATLMGIEPVSVPAPDALRDTGIAEVLAFPLEVILEVFPSKP